jgi:hypothetical protein
MARYSNVFSASNVAAQAVSVALTTVYTGLVISNPIGSGKVLEFLSGQYAISVGEAAVATQHLIAGGSSTGIITHTTALAAPGIQRALIGQGAGVATSSVGSVANADSAATVVNPYYHSSTRGGFTAGALGGPGMGIMLNLEGLVYVGPGGWVAWGALTAITGFGSFIWRELDL